MKIKIHPNGENETKAIWSEFEFIIRIKAK